MRYAAVFKLNAPLAAAVAVEWTEAATPLASGAGWQACVKLPNGDWRFASHAIPPAEQAQWRAPGPFPNIGLRYRLGATSPWSPISASRKAITLVAVIEEPVVPPALTAAQWSAPDRFDLGAGLYTAAFTLSGAPAGAEAAQWTTAADPVAQPTAWQACLPLGTGRWRLDSPTGSHAIPEGARLGDIGLRYRLAATGAWSAVSLDRKALSVPVTLIAPVLVTAPTLAGTGRIGAAATLAAGVWTGTPVPGLAQQWLRNGVAIPGATLTGYTPGLADDLTDLSCRVTATNLAGSAEATAGPIPITHVAPVAAGNLPRKTFDQAPGAQTVVTATDFTGLDLSFAVTGAGARIDAASGVVSIPTDVVLPSATVTVTARNSGGSAASSFPVTVAAVAVVPPPAPTAAQWEVGTIYDPLLAGSPLVGMIRVLSGPALAATRLYRTSLNPTGGATPGNGFEVCVRHPDTARYPNCWLWRSNSATATGHLLGTRIGGTVQTVVRYTLDAVTVAVAAAVFSLDSDRKSWVVTAAPVFSAHPTLSGSGRINNVLTATDTLASGTPAPSLTRQWFRNGNSIAGATAATYTPVTSDLGMAITFRNLASNGVSPNATSAASNAITVISNALPTSVSVATMADLEAAMTSATASGTSVRMASGNFSGSVAFANRTWARQIEVIPQDRNNPPVFTELGFALDTCDRFKLDGLVFNRTSRDTQGFPDGMSLKLSGCSNGIVTDCHFLNAHETIRADDTTNLELAYLTIERCGMDSIRLFAGQNDGWMHHCKIFNPFIDESRINVSNRHPDIGGQWAVNGSDANNRYDIPPNGVLVEDNWVESAQPGHGFFFGNNSTRPRTGVPNPGLARTLAQSGYKNLTIRRNFMRLDHVQGICIEGTDGALIEQNVLRSVTPASPTGRDPTVYLLWSQFDNIRILNNVTPSGRGVYVSDVNAGTLPKITVLNHQSSDTAVPTGWAATVVARHIAGPTALVGKDASR